MRIHAFTGTRYTEERQAGGLAGPPYDQIDEALRVELQQDPQHFAHLIRPTCDTDPHRAASRLHDEWLDAGIISTDDEPALYPYEILLPNGGRRLGLTTLVELEPENSQVVRPHEATVAKTVDERLSLLRETGIDLEPILLLADDDGGLNRLLEEDLRSQPPLVEHFDSAGFPHRLYRLADADRIAGYQRLIDPCVGLIADGHHRYTVASRYAREQGAIAGTPAATKLAVMTSLASPGLAIDPIHRQLRHAVDIEGASRLATSHHSLASSSGQAIAAAIAQAPQPALGISVGERTEIWEFDPETASEMLPDYLRHLAVGWLHDMLFPELGLLPEAATDGTVVYRSDPEQLLSELRDGSAKIGFWLPPMSGEDFARAMEGGELLPPKSTRFLPKVASGLVWAGHDCHLL